MCAGAAEALARAALCGDEGDEARRQGGEREGAADDCEGAERACEALEVLCGARYGTDALAESGGPEGDFGDFSGGEPDAVR